jgi:primary-amine oxidase
MTVSPHPLSALSIDETNLARDIVLDCHPGDVLYFRQILLHEPPKDEVLSFLELEHSDQVSRDTPRPQRLAKIQYDLITKGNTIPQPQESIIDLRLKTRVGHNIVATGYRASLTM